MKTSLVLIVSLFLSYDLFAQTNDDGWDKWNRKYPEVNVTDLFKQEKTYADSVEHHPDIPRYYFRRSLPV